jgi:hypothetical protein
MHLWGFGKNGDPTDSVQGVRGQLFSEADRQLNSLSSLAKLSCAGALAHGNTARRNIFSTVGTRPLTDA